MITELIAPPAVEPFSPTDLKTAPRIDHSADDDLVMRLGVTARAFIERRLSLAVAEQTWRLIHTGAPFGPLTLRPGNVRQVTQVLLSYGEAPPQSTDDWTLVRGLPDTLCLTPPVANNNGMLNEVSVTYIAGRSDVSTTPPELLEAIIALAAHYYEHREAVAHGRYVSMPLRVESLLGGLREVRL